jgi:hypothetical protein
MHPMQWIYYLVGLNLLYLTYHYISYRVVSVEVQMDCVSVTYVNFIGRHSQHSYTVKENIDVTYGIKPFSKQASGYVLILYDETFRAFMLFPNVDGWTDAAISELVLDFVQSGYRVNNSDDVHVW